MKRITTAILSAALIFSLSVPAMAANTIKEDVGQPQEQTTTQPQSGSMDNFKSSSTYTGFQDVATSDWFYSAVKTCYELDLMKGSSATTFNPKGNVTVAQVITMAARVHKIYHEGTGDFESVGSKWYQAYIDYAISNRIIGSKSFGGNYDRTATRAEMAGIFAHALPSNEFQAINSITALPDVTGDRYVENTLAQRGTDYYDEILTLYNAGIIAGSDKYGTFNPNSPITRAESAAIINRVAVKSERKTLTLEAWTDDIPITIYEGQTRSNRPARAGDTVIKPDGTSVVLTTTRFTATSYVNDTTQEVDILGYGQGVAPDVNLQSPSGFDVVQDQKHIGYGGWGKSSADINYINDYYFINPLTGEGHWGAEWSVISSNIYPDYDGKEGEISKDKNFMWIEEGIPGWDLIADNPILVTLPPDQPDRAAQTFHEGEVHSVPKEGDIVVKADGTRITIKKGIGGVLGAGQGVDIWTGASWSGSLVNNQPLTAENSSVGWCQRPYEKDSITGEMHTRNEWWLIMAETSPVNIKTGTYEGEITNTWWAWSVDAFNWRWIGPDV